MLSSSWLASVKCFTHVVEFPEESGYIMKAIEWLEYLALPPCHQRVLVSVIDFLFLFILLVSSVRLLCLRLSSNDNSDTSINKPLLEEERSYVKLTIWFKLSLFAVILLVMGHTTLLCLLAFRQNSRSSWKIAETVFRTAQVVTYVVVLVLIGHEKKVGAVTHPVSMRFYWIVNWVVMCLFSFSAIMRLFWFNQEIDPDLRMDDMLSLASFPLCTFLCIVAIRRSSGILLIREPVNQSESSKDSYISGFASASWFSKAVWLWMNPLLRKGHRSPLKMDEVPSLPPNLRAERMSELFESNWPQPRENLKHPVATTLVQCFWKELLFTGFLAVVNSMAMYVGPVLIQGFVDVSAGQGSSRYEGYYLLCILLLSKTIEVLSTHHFEFHSGKLGMLIRSSLVTTVFRKGLRMSCSSRQANGVGKIVNHMALDADQLAEMMSNVHNIWLMPLHIAIGLALAYVYLGVSTFAAIGAVVAILVYSIMSTRKTNSYMNKVMQFRDARMNAINEMLSNMRVIKFQAWEEYFGERVQSSRNQECSWLIKFMNSSSVTLAVIFNAPYVISALTLSAAIFLGLTLDAGTVFTATTLFGVLEEPIRNFPEALISFSQAIISLERLDHYLAGSELERSVEREEGCNGSTFVEVQNGTFSWDNNGDEKILNDINLEIKKGELAAIVGTVGSGKSSLLASILGETHKIAGKVLVRGSTGYVAQTPWIQHGTIAENILFGLPMDKERYQEVLRVCRLEKDLEMMEFGDETEIGERGINLSGGQKQRIQLARAVYQECDIYLLDDIFSAVDAQTGSEIFKECLKGILKDKTILLVTHQVDFLHNADLIMVMRDGMIVQSGKYGDLLESGMDFGALVDAHGNSMRPVNTSSTAAGVYLEQTPNSSQNPLIQPKTDSEDGYSEYPEDDCSKIIEEEEKITGHITLELYKQYGAKAYGWQGVVIMILITLLWQASLMGSDYWLAFETSPDHPFIPSIFISLYWIIIGVSCICILARAYIVSHLGLVTAQSFFSEMLQSILHAPMSFFDTTPSGRILTRASHDQENIDIYIPLFLGLTTMMYFSLLSVVFITCVFSWPTVFLLIPLIWLNIWYKDYYLASSRELTRLGSITEAPIIHHFSETMSGVMTIRCFKRQEKFFQDNIDRVNANLRMDFHSIGAAGWMGIRLELLGSLIFCIATLFLIIFPSSIIKPEFVGMFLSYGLPLNSVMFWTIYMACFLENRMVSVERIKQFTDTPPEAPWLIMNLAASPNWPSYGNIELKDLQVRYRQNTPLILKGITFSIHGGEKIGIVGRTGSGKSTLIQAFFRLVEPSGGTIAIDGVDITKLGLHDLRSRFGIIPQEPVLFKGTVRSNLDPTGLYSDEEIWQSLERCQLKAVVTAKPGKLDASVVDSGDNWSVGQRQLLCLGRVLLKRCRILFMDEATASVDSQTDVVIQRIIREDFADCTIISIAHRIPTVMDCDRVLVMDDGLAQEFDKPTTLLGRPSLFNALVQEYARRSDGM
ncbi:ABC transporter C family member 14 [Linum perenne]